MKLFQAYAGTTRLLFEKHKPTVCPRGSDPFHIVTYFIKYELLLGHTVCFFGGGGEYDLLVFLGTA